LEELISAEFYEKKSEAGSLLVKSFIFLQKPLQYKHNDLN